MRELAALRNSTIASETNVPLVPGVLHTISGTEGGAASSADIELEFALPLGNSSSEVDVFGRLARKRRVRRGRWRRHLERPHRRPDARHHVSAPALARGLPQSLRLALHCASLPRRTA